MAIKVRFAEGQTAATTQALFQWNYGQQLEIESADLPATFEVHFACADMTEAIVVPCSAVDGVGTVAIPNSCLEQSMPITAWIYEIDGETGTTTKTITIPVISRKRPATGDEVPATVADKYTELITAVNAALAALQTGTVVVAKATNATNADYATSAGNAGTAAKASTIEANGTIENTDSFGIVRIAGGSVYAASTDETRKVYLTGGMVNLTDSDGVQGAVVMLDGELALYSGDGTNTLWLGSSGITLMGTVTAKPSTGGDGYSPVITRADLVSLGLITE